MLVRSGGLAESMSRYLIRRIEENPTIELRTHTEIVALDGDEHLERVRWRNIGSGEDETRDIGHVFVMTGAVPNTAGSTAASRSTTKGFIKTGPDLTPDDLAAARWPLARPPHLLETSLPGVFAVGDVARRQRQARRLGGRRRLDRRLLRPSGLAGIEHGGSRERRTGPRASPDDDRARLADAGAAPRRAVDRDGSADRGGGNRRLSHVPLASSGGPAKQHCREHRRRPPRYRRPRSAAKANRSRFRRSTPATRWSERWSRVSPRALRSWRGCRLTA